VALGEGIHQALGREGYTVDWLKDGSSALHALLSETFDVAVLDLACRAWTASKCCDACATAARTCRC
jgi:DNA-binding response OmpR family regulator